VEPTLVAVTEMLRHGLGAETVRLWVRATGATSFGAVSSPATPGAAWVSSLDAVAADPRDADAFHLAAQVLMAMRNYDEAFCEIVNAISLRDDPAFHQTQRAIESASIHDHAMLLQQRRRYADALSAAQRARQLAPHRPEPPNTLGTILLDWGRLDEAIEMFRAAAAIDPPLRAAHSNLLLALMHSDRVTPGQLLAEHVEWSRRHTPKHDFPPPVIDAPDPDRPIRVGYVSPDFRRHPVATFILPVVRAHDGENFHITLYNDSDVEDAVKRKFRDTGRRMVDCAGWSFDRLMSQIRADRIDILIDLSVHSSSNRMGLFAARAAPIQMTWLGYAGTTGCPSVDYRITDPFTDPPGLTDSHFTERLLRLPDVLWCYDPPIEAPAIVARGTDQPIRFGAGTRLAKISDTCLDAWCALLNRVPGSTFALAADPFHDTTVRADWLARLESRGIERSRVELLPGQPYEKYFEFLNSLDIALDTFPFNGGTTACQTLWMGTPMVALAGRTSVARVTASVLRAIGLNELVAESTEDWIARNAALAADTAQRRELRGTLRERMLGSPLCDARTFTKNLEAAYRRVFRERLGAH